jgi:hypothetical protein
VNSRGPVGSLVPFGALSFTTNVHVLPTRSKT